MQVSLGLHKANENNTAEFLSFLDKMKQCVSNDSDGNPEPLIMFGDELSTKLLNQAHFSQLNCKNDWNRLRCFHPGVQDWHKRVLCIRYICYQVLLTGSKATNC